MIEYHGFGRDSTSVGLGLKNGESFAAGVSRRELLKALAAAGAGAVLPASGLIAQVTASAARANPRRIDVHHHMQPPEYFRQRGQQATNRDWTPARSIADMDQHGTATASISTRASGSVTCNRRAV